MSEQRLTEKEVGPAAVGVIALLCLFIGPFLGQARYIVAVLGGWGFAIGFTVMMWKRTKSNTTRVGLIIILVAAIAVSSNIANTQAGV